MPGYADLETAVNKWLESQKLEIRAYQLKSGGVVLRLNGESLSFSDDDPVAVTSRLRVDLVRLTDHYSAAPLSITLRVSDKAKIEPSGMPQETFQWIPDGGKGSADSDGTIRALLDRMNARDEQYARHLEKLTTINTLLCERLVTMADGAIDRLGDVGKAFGEAHRYYLRGAREHAEAIAERNPQVDAAIAIEAAKHDPLNVMASEISKAVGDVIRQKGPELIEMGIAAKMLGAGAG